MRFKPKKHKWECQAVDDPTVLLDIKATTKDVARNIAAKHWGIDPRAIRVFRIVATIKLKVK